MTAQAGRTPTDEELARELPGDFTSHHADAGGTRLHYVTGGSGEPLVLLPGYPQTWWAWHKVLPDLARHFTVIAADLRGMGGSARPADGYDKKTMAADIHALIRHLGHHDVHIAGHDMGAMVAFAFAANHPEATRKVALLDTAHPDDSYYDLRLIARPGTGITRWWWAFNQVQHLPQVLYAGHMRQVIDWLFTHALDDQSLIGDRDRDIYAAAYDHPDGIRAACAWYQAYHQDIADLKTYPKITAPLLGIGSRFSHDHFRTTLPTLADDVRVERVKQSVHYFPEEEPELITHHLLDFFRQPPAADHRPPTADR
ncbi:alpha/beta fold hydrolase [Streptomyces scabiei]|uniref:alpha/beta fold hydrolase n=1 Tax=Streptomyces scabiei TaxID=1930 RepID=UPI0036EC7DD5